jgi:hypothetical protein
MQVVDAGIRPGVALAAHAATVEASLAAPAVESEAIGAVHDADPVVDGHAASQPVRPCRRCTSGTLTLIGVLPRVRGPP